MVYEDRYLNEPLAVHMDENSEGYNTFLLCHMLLFHNHINADVIILICCINLDKCCVFECVIYSLFGIIWPDSDLDSIAIDISIL